jgi:hypothetical protein
LESGDFGRGRWHVSLLILIVSTLTESSVEQFGNASLLHSKTLKPLSFWGECFKQR